MTRLLLKDELLDMQLLRAVCSASFGGADLGECLVTSGRIDESNLDSWFVEWTHIADEVTRLAEREEAAGNLESARLAYFRASTYHRTAGVMALDAPLDPKLVRSNASHTETFRRAAALLALPPELLEIPWQGVTLPGYFFRAADDGAARATVILTGGYDSTCEELYFWNGAAALARGYNVLAFDGPGQGGALIQRGLPLRADWESVVTPVLDYALRRSDVDPRRVALIGLSLGGHLAPRAVSVEHRFAACIADCGSFDLYASFLSRLPRPLAQAFAGGRGWARSVVGWILGRLARKPTAGWALRRGQLVHGVESPLAFVDTLRQFSLAGHASRITCPTLVCSAEGDDISASAAELVAALTCPKEHMRFSNADGAAGHCEQGARTLYHARTFAWLDALLTPRTPSRAVA